MAKKGQQPGRARILPIGAKYRPKVMVCMPYYAALKDPAVCLIEQLCTHGIPGYEVFIGKRKSAIIQFARNEIVGNMALPAGADYVFMFDDDMGFLVEEMLEEQPSGLSKIVTYMRQILDYRLNICGGLYVTHDTPYLPHAYTRLPAATGSFVRILNPPDKGVVEVDAVATGFLCIRSNVFQAFQEDFEKAVAAKTRYEAYLATDEGKAMLPTLSEELRDYLKYSRPAINPPFWLDYIYDRIERAWMNVGEDIFFCREAKRLGFKIYCDCSVRLGHESTFYPTVDHYNHAFKERVLQEHAGWRELHGFPPLTAEYGVSDNGNGSERPSGASDPVVPEQPGVVVPAAH